MEGLRRESITLTSQLKIEGGQIARGDLNNDRSKRRLRLPDFLIADPWAHSQAQFEIQAEVDRQAPDLIFTNFQGGSMRSGNLRKRFITICMKADVEPHKDG